MEVLYMVTGTANPLEALQMALKREKDAEAFYLQAAKTAEEEGARKMYEFLAGEERKHQRIIQDEIDKNFLKEM
jgi:rubrerythrin